MLGNFLLFIKKFVRQNFFCLHTYISVYRKDNGNTYQECVKCELLKEY